jgi:hypothetical protein
LELAEAGARPMDADVRSLLVMPLLHRGAADHGTVIGVLFADTTQINSFTDEVSAQIRHALAGFAKLLDRVVDATVREVTTVDVVPEDESRNIDGEAPRLDVLEPISLELPTTRLPRIDLEWTRRLVDFTAAAPPA